MLKDELKETSKVPDLKLTSLKNLVPLFISDEILRKIKFLCTHISEDEWSGVLFYSVKGTIADFENLRLKVEDIYLMDRGTAGGTQYELDENLIEYRMNNPESLKWKMGHVHSHNNMRTYFSGTDMSELNDNSEFHNYYLSLIVNNSLNMAAKIAFRGDNNSGFQCKDEKGEDWNLMLKKPTQTLFTFECAMVYETDRILVDDSFRSRMEKILLEKEKKEKAIEKKRLELDKRKTGIHWYKNAQGDWVKIDGNIIQSDSEFDFEEKRRKVYKVEDDDDDDELTLLEEFILTLLRFGDITLKRDTIDDALEDIQASEIPINDLALRLIEKYPEDFQEYWGGTEEITMEEFTETTQDVLDTLEEYVVTFPFVEELQQGLKMMLNRLSVMP